jgi:transposase
MTPPKNTRVQLEEAIKKQFIGVVSGGQSVRSAAKKYGICKSMAQDIWTKWKKKGSTENLPRTGRPKKTTERMECSITRESLANRRKLFCEIANATNPRISTSTIRNILRRKVLGDTQFRRLQLRQPRNTFRLTVANSVTPS